MLEIVNLLQVSLSVIGILATFSSGLWGLITRLRPDDKPSNVQITIEGEPLITEDKKRRHLENRLNEVRTKIQELGRKSSTYAWINHGLWFGQVAIGITLASTLFDNLSGPIVAVFGLVVALSSSLHKYIKPDVLTRVYQSKATILKSSLRDVEDGMVSGEINLQTLIQKLSNSLNAIEHDSELVTQFSSDSSPKLTNTEI